MVGDLGEKDSEELWKQVKKWKDALSKCSSLAPAGSIFFSCYQKLIVPLSLPGMLTEQCWVVDPVKWQKAPNSFILQVSDLVTWLFFYVDIFSNMVSVQMVFILPYVSDQQVQISMLQGFNREL